MGNVTMVSSDPQEVVERVLSGRTAEEEPTPGEEAPAGDETVPEAPPENEEQEEPEEPKEPLEAKPSKRSQKIKRLADKLTQTERERDELREQLAQARAGRTEQPKESTTDDGIAPYPVPKPKASDYPNDPQSFVEALTDWKSDERDYRKNALAHQYAAKEQHRAIADDHNSNVTQFRVEHPDFDKVIEGVRMPIPDIPETKELQNALREAIQENEDGPAIMYYFAKHPEAMDPLTNMTPTQAKVYIGRVAARLESPVASAPIQKPKPRLITPVGGSTRAEIDRSEMSYRDWKQARKAGTIR